MNFLISMNSKMFSKYNSKTLIETIINLDVNKYVSGAEIYIDMLDESEKEYCLILTNIMKNNDWIIQVHSVSMYNLEEESIAEYLDYYNKIALTYGKTLKLTIHPAQENSIEESIIKTIETISYINKYVKQNKLNIEILVENLNELNGILRCNIYQIYQIIDKLKVEGITLDMGHYVYDYSNDYTNFNTKYISRIKNIHIHDINNDRIDHYPFYYNNVKIELIVKYIKEINYKENIVLEYGLEYLKGETFENKISEYINQIEYVSRYFISMLKIKMIDGG